MKKCIILIVAIGLVFSLFSNNILAEESEVKVQFTYNITRNSGSTPSIRLNIGYAFSGLERYKKNGGVWGCYCRLYEIDKSTGWRYALPNSVFDTTIFDGSFYYDFEPSQKQKTVYAEMFIGIDGGKLYYLKSELINIPANNELDNLPVSMESLNGLHLDDDGIWRYYDKGVFVKTSCITPYGDGYFFVANGELCANANGLAEYGGQWFFLANGQIQTQYTGLALYDGHWFYVKNGRFNPAWNGLVDYDGSKFIVAAGEVIGGVNGLWQNTDGIWYYLSNSQVVTYYTGLTQYDGHWFYVINGRLATEYTGIVEYDGATFQVVNGEVA